MKCTAWEVNGISFLNPSLLSHAFKCTYSTKLRAIKGKLIIFHAEIYLYLPTYFYHGGTLQNVEVTQADFSQKELILVVNVNAKNIDNHNKKNKIPRNKPT